jgi:polyphosphate kinase
MKKAGIDLIYSLPGLKVHAKVALVVRRQPNGEQKRYAYMGTGNFNENTARTYTDHGLLTCHPKLTKELGKVFDYLCGYKKDLTFKHLLVSRFNLQATFLELIDREIKHVKNGLPASIIIKLNNLEDEKMIDKLYEAGRAGVQISLIIRGICCLVPGVKGLSENIRVIRLVDKYLEHARVFVFNNNQEPEVYLASADWMKRNLYRRIEVGFPVYDENLKAQLLQLMDMQLRDNLKAVWLNPRQENMPVLPQLYSPLVRAQSDIYEWLKRNEENHSSVSSVSLV